MLTSIYWYKLHLRIFTCTFHNLDLLACLYILTCIYWDILYLCMFIYAFHIFYLLTNAFNWYILRYIIFMYIKLNILYFAFVYFYILTCIYWDMSLYLYMSYLRILYFALVYLYMLTLTNTPWFVIFTREMKYCGFLGY